jgi:hypothetical protein
MALVIVVLLVTAFLSPGAAADCTPAQPDPFESMIAVDPAVRQRQEDALRSMSLDLVEYSLRGPVKRLRGETGIVLPVDIARRQEGDSVDDVLHLFADVLLANGTESLVLKQHRERLGAERSLMLTQTIRGIPVFNSVVAIAYDGTTRRVTQLIGSFIPDRDLPQEPRLSAEEAEQVVPRALAIAERIDASVLVIEDGTQLGYYADEYSPEPVQLVWVVTVGGGWQETFYVDAMTGIVANRLQMSTPIISMGRTPIEVTGARCECAGRSLIPAKPMRRIPECGRLVRMTWSPMPGVDRYVGQMALPELGWVFSDLVIDGSSPQCACEVPQTAAVRMRACNSCGCGPWSKGQLIEVKNPCPLVDELAASDERAD